MYVNATWFRRLRFAFIAASLALTAVIPILHVVGLKPVSDLAVLVAIFLMTGYYLLLLYD